LRVTGWLGMLPTAMARPLLLTRCRPYDAGPDASLTDVGIAGGGIRDVRPGLAGPEPEVETLDAGGRRLIPGLIDLHVHGAGGADVLDGSAEAMATIARHLARLGTTSFLATTFLHPVHGDAHLPAAGDAVGRDLGGARVLGLHLEGPFISPVRRGGIPPEALREPSPAALHTLVDRSAGGLRMLTIAPELEGAMALLPALDAAGVVASFGHSDATYEQTRAALDAGVRHVTHLYNAMRPLHHREPGPIPAVFEASDVVAQLIVDGAHVDPVVIRWTAATLGADRCACVTDGLRAVGLPDGTYDYGGRPFESRDGVARYLDGALVGTTLSLLGVAQRFARFAGLPFATAVDSASRVPAQVLGLDHRKGRIAAGYDADLVLLDHDGSVYATIVAGDVVYRKVA
jgi:N-acetylglucosamine-6-phosphate deacetylase